jgi:hypothetical protein
MIVVRASVIIVVRASLMIVVKASLMIVFPLPTSAFLQSCPYIHILGIYTSSHGIYASSLGIYASSHDAPLPSGS